MKIFKMSGMQITGPQRFLTYFSPTDYLKQKKLAAGFACYQLSYLSAWNKYNSELLYFSVFFPEKISIETYTDYFWQDPPRNNMKNIEKPLPGQKAEDHETVQLLKSIWELTEQTSLEKTKKARLFCILSAGYLLAEKDLDSLSITPEEAENAYRGRTPEEKEDRWDTFGTDKTKTLAARVKPYRILMGTEKALPQGKRISLKKIVAEHHAQGNANLPLQLECYRGEGDTAPAKLSFLPGDYRYCLFVDDTPVQFLNTVSENGPCRMERKGDTLFLYQNDKKLQEIPCPDKDIVSFAPEESGNGWIIAKDGQMDYNNYSLYHVYSSSLSSAKNVVQVQFRGPLCLLLHANGRVTANMPGDYGKGKLSLDDVKI